MANHGAGTKFASVNLNKSYGQSPNHHHQQHYNAAHSGFHTSNRARPGTGGAAGGGMVVLSRPRSSQKTGSKLSVPPPLNLPSLRKEHERFDPTGSGGSHASGGVSGNGSRPSSSGVGWTKPATVPLQEKEGSSVNHLTDSTDRNGDGVGKRTNGVYMPPSTRSVGMGPLASSPTLVFPPLQKAIVLKGEDFPSLQAALPAMSGTEKKQKEGLIHKYRQMGFEESPYVQTTGSRSSSLVTMRPQLQSGNDRGHSVLNENYQEGVGLSGKARKQDDCFPGPLPLVRLNRRSDWADDERDVSRSLSDQGHMTDRGRDHLHSKTDAYWDSEFDLPRTSMLLHRPANSLVNKWRQHDNEIGKTSSSEVNKTDSYGQGMRTPSGEGQPANSWRVSSPLSRDGFATKEAIVDRNGNVARPSVIREKDNKYITSTLRGSAQDDVRRDSGQAQVGQHPWNNPRDSFITRGPDANRREPFASDQFHKYKNDTFRNSSVSKPNSSIGIKGLPVINSIASFGREKRPYGKNDKLYAEDPFIKDFTVTGLDGHDTFPGSVVAVVKRRKDLLKETNFHDPIRESFEAELERVQQMQEQERQRVIEEQERALEMARRDEEERIRLVKEREEKQRRVEEEAREAAWRAEQERKEATRRADEQRIAREEEKHRMLMEEERRKQAAKQKLLELEEKIAKRQGESVRSGGAVVSDERPFALVKERDLIKVADVGDWEDGERMVERITTSASSDSSSLNRPFEANSRSHFLRDGSVYSGRGKSFNSWRRDGSESGNGSTFVGQDADNGLHSLRRDDSVGGRTCSKKELYGDSGFTSVRSYYRAGVPEPTLDDFGHHRNERWNIFGEGDHYGRNAQTGSDFRENMAENFGDTGWGHHSRNNAYSPFPERFYQNPDGDGVYSYGTSRYSMRQPRVPPPPSLFGIQKMSHRGQNEEPGSTFFPDNEVLYNSETSGSTMDRNYDGGQKDNLRHPSIVDIQPDKPGSGVKKLDSGAARCDSQSSVSVSSPPDSPIHLSHDDLDEFEDSAGFSIDQEKEVRLSGQGSEPRHLTSGATREKFGAATGSISAADDEEWNDNNNKLQEQEEYDEDEEGYQDEEELREGENVNTDLSQEFEVMHLGEKESEHMVDNLVLGFNEGVEVAMPSDEFEKNSANEDTAYAMSHMTTVILEEKGPVAGMHGREVHQCVDSFAQGTADGSNIFNEAEGMRDLAVQANNSFQTSIPSESKEHLDTSGNACILAQNGFSSSFNIASHSSSAQSVMPSASSVQNSAEVPIKLQFGLFSGPSLIPSPVPAIQIGSIQMPLHLHSHAGTSLTHMHPSQPPLFQFGQLRYASPVSQGLLTSGSQSMPFAQPSILNHSSTITRTVQSAQETSSNVKEEILAAGHCGEAPLTKQGAAEGKNTDDSRFKWQTGFVLEDQEANSAQTSFKTVSVNESVDELHTVSESSHVAFSDKDSTIPKPQGQIYGGRGKRHAFTVKRSNPRLFAASEVPRHDSIRFQKRNRRLRMEFRIRENADKNQTTEMASSHLDDRTEANSRSSGNFSKYGTRKVFMVNKPKMNEVQCSGLTPATSQEVDHEGRAEKGVGKETSVRSKRTPPYGESNHKRNIDKDMDGTLQSGVVQVFEQPGIEAPSDEDDFIEVRSKRQMLNNRREQREKEIKAKSRNLKFPRKPALASQNTTSSTSSNKLDAPTNGGAINSFSMSFVGSARQNIGRAKVSGGFNATIGSKSLADRKDPNLTSIANTCTSASPGNESDLEPDIVFASTDKIIDNVQIPVSSWGNSATNQQFHSSSSIGDRTSVGESMSSSSSVLMKEKQFTTSTCSIKYLLGGENIQFGAVTSSAVLPQSSRVHGVGPPGPCRKEVQISPHHSSAENGCTLLFEKEKPSCESSSCLEDSEAEAAAAASAVAVAAITNNEVVGNGIDSFPVSVSEVKSFGGTENGGISTGVAVDQQLSGQSKVEDSLSVSLPADLSVESPPISLWPAMPSPQSSSGQIISHFPGGPTHFPFFEMNPMLRSPVFAFGRHEESSSAQPQTQKSTGPSSSPVGTWQQCHSGVDSFYGPPAGFTGPFIGSPGGIPGVQGHRHMVVYNHFAPVGQFGQLGLSFMGTTYLPSGKQPDWKHSPAISAMSVSEEEMNSMNMTSSQHNPSNLPTPMQHLAPGSPLMPIASPLTMFDVSPFQATPDVPVQPHWLHVPPLSLPPAPLSLPLNQQAEAVLSSQYNNHAIDNTSASNKFSESRSSTPSNSSWKFTMTSNATVAQLPDELGLTETSSSTFIRSSVQNVAKKSSQLGAAAYTAKVDVHNRDGKSNGQGSSSALKTVSLQQKSSQHFNNSSGNNHSKGARASSKNSSGDWSHRRMGFQARNPSFGSDKIFSASKIKQIYVAKQTSGSSNSS